ncbi:hypothetical protein FRC01_005286, partial [Tulasnella sp. 417]
IDRCNQPPYGGPPTPPEQIISIFGGACSQFWFAVVDVTLKNEKEPFTLKDISAIILGKMKQTAKTTSARGSARPAPQPPPLTEPPPQAMHQDQLSDLKYAELQANAKGCPVNIKDNAIHFSVLKRRLVDQELATEDEAADLKVSSTDVPVSRRTRAALTRTTSQSGPKQTTAFDSATDLESSAADVTHHPPLRSEEEDDDDERTSTPPPPPLRTKPVPGASKSDAHDTTVRRTEKQVVSETAQTPSSREPTLAKETQQLPEAPPTHALLPLASHPEDDNALQPASIEPPSQPARNPLSQRSSVHAQAPIPETILLYRRNPIRRQPQFPAIGRPQSPAPARKTLGKHARDDPDLVETTGDENGASENARRPSKFKKVGRT